jgi:arylsulfatase A-like enzyme
MVYGPLFLNGSNVNRTGLMHITDWFPTLLSAAGVPFNPLPDFPLHGVDQWQMLVNDTASPRTDVLLNIDPYQSVDGPYAPGGGGNAAIISGEWKLTLGAIGPPWDYSPDDARPARLQLSNQQALAEGPNDSPVDALLGLGPRHQDPLSALWPISNQTVQLYNLTSDAAESTDLSEKYPDVVSTLMAKLNVWATQVMVPPLFCFGKCVDPDSYPSKHNESWVPWDNNS